MVKHDSPKIVEENRMMCTLTPLTSLMKDVIFFEQNLLRTYNNGLGY